MKYFEEYGTPLKYHNFLKYAGIPLSCVVLLFRIFGIMAMEPWERNDFYTVDMWFMIVSLIVYVVTLYGFHTWKPCGFFGILANYGIGVVYNICAICIYNQYAPSLIATAVGQLIGEGIIAVLVVIYYWKRRLLFFPEMRQQYMDMMYATPAVQQQSAAVHLEDKSMGDRARCSCCGELLNMGRNACMKCGTPIGGRKDTQKEQPKPAAYPSYCRKCGNKLVEDSSFCSHCGTKVI